MSNPRVFSLEDLADLCLNPTHRRTVIALIGLLRALPQGTASVRCRETATGRFDIELIPRAPGAAALTIYLCGVAPDSCGSSEVVISAGEDIGIDVRDTRYDDPNPDVAELFENIVRAIISGRVRETLHYRGNTMYRSECWVGTCGKPVELDRTNVPKWLSSLGRKRSKKTICYKPYVRDEAD